MSELGVSSVLSGAEPLDRALSPVPSVDSPWTLGSREVAANPTELLGGNRMRALIDDLGKRFDIVLIDSPPVLPEPYVPSGGWSPDGAGTARNGHGKQNGSPLSSGRPGRHRR
jgi:hypothetical protein